MPRNAFFQYDVGIFQMLKGLLDETYFVDTPDNAFIANAKAHNGKVLLPMISLSRMGDFSVATDMYNDQAVRVGYPRATRGAAEFPDQKVRVHSLPVALSYQIDVWAKRRDVCDGIAAELMLEFKEHPHFLARTQDMGTNRGPIEYDFLIDDSVSDNTGITEFSETGRFYRLTLTGNVPSAIITRVDTFNRVEYSELELDVQRLLDDEVEHTETVIEDRRTSGGGGGTSPLPADPNVIEDEVDHTPFPEDRVMLP